MRDEISRTLIKKVVAKEDEDFDSIYSFMCAHFFITRISFPSPF